MGNILEIGKKAIQLEAEMISQLAFNLDSDFENAVNEIIASNGKLIVTGMGKSGIVGKKIAATLASTGTPSFFIHPGEAFHGDLGMIEEKDSILAISYSGETDEVLKLIPFFRDNQNLVIGMSGNKNSTLAKNSRYHLNVHVEKEACPLELAPTSSTTATMVMGDALAISLMEKKQFKKEHFARFHPGGSLGKRLLTRVTDIMHKHNLPVVSESANLMDIISAISNSNLGLVIVLKENKILGIITDGDLRKSFGKKSLRLDSLKASDIMTKNPVIASDNISIDDAKSIMENDNINSLIISDEENVQGIITYKQLFTL